MALVEKAMQHSPASETALQPCDFGIAHMRETTPAQNNPEEYGVRPRTQDTFVYKEISEMSDVSVEDGARLFLEFVASVRAAHGTPSP